MDNNTDQTNGIKEDNDSKSVNESEEFLTKRFLNNVKGYFTDVDTIKIFDIQCEGAIKKELKIVREYLIYTLQFNVCRPYIKDKLWFIEGTKDTTYDQLESALTLTKVQLQLNNCRLVNCFILNK